MTPKPENWSEVEKAKKELFEDAIEGLDEQQFELLKTVLELEAKNRHLTKPQGMKAKVVDIIERVVE